MTDETKISGLSGREIADISAALMPAHLKAQMDALGYISTVQDGEIGRLYPDGRFEPLPEQA